MVKRRSPQAAPSASRRKSSISKEQVEAFASQADLASTEMLRKRSARSDQESESKDRVKSALSSDDLEHLDPNAKRNYKAMNITLNEYEYRVLEILSERLKRTKLNVIRLAVSDLDKKFAPDPAKIKRSNNT